MEFKEIEEKWQKFWEEHPDLYKAKDDFSKEKKYVLVEFPYPSGSGLHVGHAFSFTGGDVYARVKRMQGYNVMFPMGWDAFGLPTENYAIKAKRKPQEVTKENTDMFRSQMKRLAYSFDWSREVNTTDPNYYKWTQWIFIKLFEKGLAYKQKMPINWCPSCKIGLANEEVVNGKCERCGAEVSRRNISQWVVKITDYADKLIEGLKETDFIEKVKMAQINWIGKSEGARVIFKIDDPQFKEKTLEVFTTRPDTLPGVTFMVISPEHPLVSELILSCSRPSSDIKSDSDDCARKINPETIESIKKYIKETKKKSDLERTDLNKDKTGVFSGIMMINPINGKKVPLWIADYVLMGYGTGVVMGVPAHDERDHEFAKKYGLEIIPVIKKEGWNFEEKPLTEVDKGEEFEKMLDFIEDKGLGKRSCSYHLRDWIFSRQHYWGEPIPMIFCEKCSQEKKLEISNLKFNNEEERRMEEMKAGWFAEKEENLPIRLPEVEAYEPTDDGQSPLSRIESFVNCKCPRCGGEAKRETDTMPNWAGSDWYYMRYCDNQNDKELIDKEKWSYWGPVDIYIGGDEHNTLHLLYSRFIHQFLYDLGVVSMSEPYRKRISHGVILGPDNQRMSKSHGNVIVPEVVADKFGVDVVRCYLMFMGPFTGTMAWNENTLMGVKRFLDRFEKYINEHMDDNTASNDNIKVIINKLIKGVIEDVESFGYNTMIAKMMQTINELSNSKEKISKEDLKILVKLIAPLAPYTAEELWHRFENNISELESVHASEWPQVEKKYLIEATITIPIAINGKVRGQLEVESEEKEVIQKAKELPEIKKWFEGKKIVKEIYIPGKMVNIVLV